MLQHCAQEENEEEYLHYYTFPCSLLMHTEGRLAYLAGQKPCLKFAKIAKYVLHMIHKHMNALYTVLNYSSVC